MSNSDHNVDSWDRAIICSCLSGLLAASLTLLVIQRFDTSKQEIQAGQRREAMMKLMIQTQQQKILDLTTSLAQATSRPTMQTKPATPP